MTSIHTPHTRAMESKPPISVASVFALVAGFVALAAIGATLGWVLTDPASPVSSASTLPPASPVVTTSPPSLPPSPTPSPSASPLPTAQVVPDFVNTPTDFRDARNQLRALNVGVVLIFQNVQDGNVEVSDTDPAAGQPMPIGSTVKIYVYGSAPQLDVPDVTNVACATAGKKLAATGFKPFYASGKTGVVLSQVPDSANTDAHWNDDVTLTCGKPIPLSPSADPFPSASATAPAAGG